MAGQSIERLIQVKAPNHIGPCSLGITLVRERICWFGDPYFKSVVLNVDVR